MLDVCVLNRFSITERNTCQLCNGNDDKFYFHCELSDGPLTVICGACLHAMSQDRDSFLVHSPREAEGIGEIGIHGFLEKQYFQEHFSTDWAVAKAILLPHQETNQQESSDGEWILTAFVDSKGKVLEQDKNHISMGIYPNCRVAEREINSYLRNRGAKEIRFEYIKVNPDNWKDIKALLNSPYAEFAWSVFTRSKSNEDIRKYIENIRTSLASAGKSF